MNNYMCYYAGKKQLIPADTDVLARDKAAALWYVKAKDKHRIAAWRWEKR